MSSKARPRLIFRPSVLSLCALSIAGCGGSIPQQVLSKPLPSVTLPVAPSGAVAWAYHPPTQRHVYVLEQRALLTIGQDSALRVDSVFSHAEVEFTSAAATGRVAGSLRVFRVEGPAHEPSTPASLVLPFAFSADYPAYGQQLVFSTTSDTAPCASSGLAVVQSLRDLWFQPPDTLRLGTTWEDSASYVVCRDHVPLHAIVRRAFRITGVEERAGRLVFLVGRSSRTTIATEAELSGETLAVSGAGTGELSYAIDPSNGEVLSARGSAVLDLVVRIRLRTERVHQASDTRVSRGA